MCIYAMCLGVCVLVYVASVYVTATSQTILLTLPLNEIPAAAAGKFLSSNSSGDGGAESEISFEISGALCCWVMMLYSLVLLGHDALQPCVAGS